MLDGEPLNKGHSATPKLLAFYVHPVGPSEHHTGGMSGEQLVDPLCLPLLVQKVECQCSRPDNHQTLCRHEVACGMQCCTNPKGVGTASRLYS